MIEISKSKLMAFGEACARIDKPVELIAKERGLVK